MINLFINAYFIKYKELVYLVQPLPQSLLYYVFSFGRIDDNDEKKYIYNMKENLFSKDEKYLHGITTEAISECHKYLRKIYNPSFASLWNFSKNILLLKMKMKKEKIMKKIIN